ncbi:hypothetical protein BGW36DRAFT_356916 [Talaromyces proteolyticus]|uniref:Knr4/Smi1-like domain-containing protein n=1 Tax=Talaromyces proteolyticus TaxID=1131652 RepID=A0AAD4Q2A5_9EURO|nr:uncharacterized protein BGW36DRAFT_356916 [Talaromyces proteolyticus]KAH8700252.1 hypothetical protein BGW36DRAFT_356916 [Talaromyces proteolyticus]
MAGFLRNFSSLDIRSERPVDTVKFHAARKAVELSMLGLVSESCLILELLPEHGNVPNANVMPDEAQFLFEAIDKMPEGFERLGKEELKDLEEESIRKIPYLPEEVNVVNGSEDDFQALKSWIKELDSDEDIAWGLNATTGYHAMRLSGSLTGLLNIALTLNKTTEADDIMTRIADRIHANQQAMYLSGIRKAWSKYFVFGWLRNKLGVAENELKEYAAFIHETTKKRLEGGTIKPLEMFRNKSMEDILKELDKNTLRFKEKFEEILYHSDDDDEDAEDDAEAENNEERPSKQQKYTAPDTILRAPATAEQIVAAELKLGRPLPDDLKDFYAMTNGTRLVIRGPRFHILSNRLPNVQSLFWEEDDYMTDYQFNLFPDAKLPVSIEWPGIEGGGIAMYEHNGQGTEYVWYIQGELLDKARNLLGEAYGKANETEKKAFDGLVAEYHGSWEQLRNLQGCWYQQSWGSPDGMVVFHNFRAYLSLVLFQSIFEEDRSPLKALDEEY